MVQSLKWNDNNNSTTLNAMKTKLPPDDISPDTTKQDKEEMDLDFGEYNDSDDNSFDSYYGLDDNSTDYSESPITAADDFYYESETMFIPETQEEINENNTTIQDEITKLTEKNNELIEETERLESLKENFENDYDYSLKNKYGLNENAAGKIMTPSEYEISERSNNFRFYHNNSDGTFNEELLQERVADYADRYSKALSETTDGEFTDIDVLNEKISGNRLKIASNNEDIRLQLKEQQEAEYDDKALTDCFKDNMSYERTYEDKLADLVQDSEKCSDVLDSLLIDVPTASNAEAFFKESTGKDISAYDLLECIAEEKFGITPEKLRSLTAEEAEELIQNLQNNEYYWAVDAYNTYKYLNDKQLAMIKTIAETDGIQAASEYYECIEEKITSLQGMEEAIDFFNNILEKSGYDIENVKIIVDQEGKFIVYTLNENGEYEANPELTTNVGTIFNSFTEGVGDGVIGFFDGLANAISSSDNKTKTDYKQIYIAYFLSNYVVLKGSYDVGKGVGNLLPSIATNALLGFAGVPVAVQSNLGYMLLGISTYGSSMHEYMTKGITGSRAVIGSILKGVLEYATGKAFGRIPWLNEEATLALSNYFKTGSNMFTSINWGQVFGAIADNMVHEGVEEFIQSYIEAGIDTVATGKPYEIKETSKEALYSFLIGALTSGILSGTNVAIDFTFNEVEYHMTQQEIEDFLSNAKTSEDITALNIFTTMKKYNCSTYTANAILKLQLNETQIESLVEQMNRLEKNDVKVYGIHKYNDQIIIVSKPSEDNIANTDIPTTSDVIVDGKVVRIISETGVNQSIIEKLEQEGKLTEADKAEIQKYGIRVETIGASKHIDPLTAGYTTIVGSFDFNPESQDIADSILGTYDKMIQAEEAKMQPLIDQMVKDNNINIEEMEEIRKKIKDGTATLEERKKYGDYNNKVKKILNNNELYKTLVSEKDRIKNLFDNNSDLNDLYKNMKMAMERFKKTPGYEGAVLTDEKVQTLYDSYITTSTVSEAQKTKIRKVLETTEMTEAEIDALMASSDEEIITAAVNARYDAYLKAIANIQAGKIVVKEGDKFVTKNIEDLVENPSGDNIKDIEGIVVYTNVGTEENPYYIECVFKSGDANGVSNESLVTHIFPVEDYNNNKKKPKPDVENIPNSRSTLDKSAYERGGYIIPKVISETDKNSLVSKVKSNVSDTGSITEADIERILDQDLDTVIGDTFETGDNRISNEHFRELAEEGARKKLVRMIYDEIKE